MISKAQVCGIPKFIGFSRKSTTVLGNLNKIFFFIKLVNFLKNTM